VYDQVLPRSWLVLEKPFAVVVSGQTVIPATLVRPIKGVSQRTRSDYGIAVKCTQLQLDQDWLRLGASGDTPPVCDDFSTIRGTTAYVQSEELPLVDEPIDPLAEPIAGSLIELDSLQHGLESGRWLVVSGERLFGGQSSGVMDSELVMLDSVEQTVQTYLPPLDASGTPTVQATRPGDSFHSVLHLAVPLAYQYKRDTVTVNGNVVGATQGETRTEVLGSGDASQPLQTFTLRQSPLTYVSAATESGIASTLSVYVNGVRWQEQPSFVGLGPTDQCYTTWTGDDQKTTVTFGDGVEGARAPTGVENVTAAYRTGIGLPGNVKAGQITLLATRPLGVRGVNNPQPATGGADRDDIEQGRRNVPLGMQSLERLVSVEDYENFALAFAGVGKARAALRPYRRRLAVHLTIAGAGGAPLDPNSDLVRSLAHSLYRYGDPAEPVRIVVAERIVPLISAAVQIDSDHLWENVQPAVTAALLDAFGFDRRDLGQPLFLSEIVAVIQGVAGVVAVHVAPIEQYTKATVTKNAALGSHSRMHHRRVLPVGPDQIAFLTDAVPDALILTVQTS
jgi:hypothetical protein